MFRDRSLTTEKLELLTPCGMRLKNRAHSDRAHNASAQLPTGQRHAGTYGLRDAPRSHQIGACCTQTQISASSSTLKICCTAQHRSMVDEALSAFELMPDYDLGIMQPDQTLSGIAAAVFHKLDLVLQDFRPDWVLVQGDTTTSMAAALASFHRQIPVGHVEAGLRTGDLRNPWPEEANRRITSIVTRRHYCSTERARKVYVPRAFTNAI